MDRQNKRRFISIIFFITLVINFITLSGCLDQNGDDKNINDISLKIGLGIDNYINQYFMMGRFTDQILSINSNIYNSLVEFDEKFEIIPSLATNWYNPDNLTWRFNLREDVKFHNGYDFSAEDVKFTIEKIKENKVNSVYLHFVIIEDINIIDNHTIDIITNKPDPILLNYLTYVFIVSKKYYEETNNIPQIGTGPYKFVYYNENESLKLERFDRYWGKRSSYNNVTFNFYATSIDQLDALFAGDLDFIYFIEPEQVENASNKEDFKIVMFSFPVFYYLGFDFRENDSCCFEGKNPVSDIRVRKAIYHSIDIEEIISNNLMGSGKPLSQYVNSFVIGFNPTINRYTYDLNIARNYMKESGYEHGFEIDLDCFDIGYRKNVSLMISNQLSEINISVNVNVLTRYDYVQKVFVNRNSSLYFYGWKIDTGDSGEIFNSVLHSIDEKNGFGDSNFGYYSNHEIDIISENISYEMNKKKRIDLLQEGFEISMNDVSIIPLYNVEYAYVMKDQLSFTPRADSILKIDDIIIL